MGNKIMLYNDKKIYGRATYLSQYAFLTSFGNRVIVDETDYDKPNAFITGYVDNADKLIDIREKICDAKLDNNRILTLVDPDFADNGALYDGVTSDYVINYKKLMEISDISTPNLTEACILADVSYEDYKNKYAIINYDHEKKNNDEISKKIIESVLPLVDKIRFKKNQITIITGIKLYNAMLTVLDVYDGDHQKRQTTCNYSEIVEERVGKGELFDAMFFSTSTSGWPLVDALSISTSFINNSLRFTRDNKFNENEGIVFEPILHDNVQVIKNNFKERNKK